LEIYNFLLHFFLYLQFLKIWKGGGRGTAKINSVGWHTYHQKQMQAPGCATRRTAGRAARQTNYSVTAPLDLRTNGRRTPIHTNGHRGPAPLESTAGFMYRTLGLRLGVGLGLLESTTHRWTGQLGPRHPPAPARTYSHHWRGTCRGREDQRGPTRDGTGRRRRLRRAEPGRAGT
jgi:hypothetical protein